MDQPYFFKNKLVNNTIYLAQNTSNLPKALEIYRIWKDDGFNSGNDPNIYSKSNIKRFSLFAYKNSTNIIRYKIGGIPEKGDPILLGYKIEDKTFYTTLLEL